MIPTRVLHWILAVAMIFGLAINSVAAWAAFHVDLYWAGAVDLSMAGFCGIALGLAITNLRKAAEDD